MDSHSYYILFGSFILFTAFFSSIKLLTKGNHPSQSIQTVPFKVFLLLIFVVGLIGFFPAEYGNDKERYLNLFNTISNTSFNKDFGWVFYTYLFKMIFNNTTLYFLITAVFYTIGNYLFLRKIVPENYLFYILLTTFGSLGYFGYGVNTIRAGVGLSLFLIAFTFKKKLVFFILISFLAVLIHKSILILLVAFIITQYVSNPSWFLRLWVLFFIFSVLDISIISDFIRNNFAAVDMRVSEYLSNRTNELYDSRYRYDFLIYSIIPILMGYYYLFKLKFKNTTYLRLFNIYLVVNAFWLLVIRIPFTDRFAYLSWFLYPILMLYPLFFDLSIKNRNRKITIIMLSIILFNFILTIR